MKSHIPHRLTAVLAAATVLTLLLPADPAAAQSRRGGSRGGSHHGDSSYRGGSHHGGSSYRGGHHGGYRHGGHGHGRSYYRPRHHHGSGLSFSLGLAIGAIPYYRAYAPAYYAPYYYGRVYDPVPVYRSYAYDREPSGQVETDVKPSAATVFVDGRAIGIADDFDGWPSKLRLSSGSHEIEFREPGYRTLRVNVEVLPYHTVRIRERLVRGDDDGDDRSALTYEDDRAVARYQVESSYDVAPAAYSARVEPERREVARGDRRGGGELALEVTPADAIVFIDGRRYDGRSGDAFVLDLEAGTHRVEVVKPGFETFTGEVVVREGQGQELAVRLQRNRS